MRRMKPPDENVAWKLEFLAREVTCRRLYLDAGLELIWLWVAVTVVQGREGKGAESGFVVNPG